MTGNKRLIREELQTNVIHNFDCQHMAELPDESIDLFITSPPYNTTKRYDDDLTLNEYLEFIHNVMNEVYRVMKSGGIVAFNIANVGRKPYLPLDCYVIQILHNLGLDRTQMMTNTRTITTTIPMIADATMVS